MSVSARFYVSEIVKRASTNSEQARTVTLLPVTRSAKPSTSDSSYHGYNADWSKYTPSGKFEMTVTTDAAGEWFEERLGKDVSITFDDPIDI